MCCIPVLSPLAVLVLGFWLRVVEGVWREGWEVEEGGRQNSSKRSACREACRWMWVWEESRDMVVVSGW